MKYLQNLIDSTIINTLKHKGLFYDAKGKLKFNRDSFNKEFNRKLSHGNYPAHIVKKMVDDSLYDIKAYKEYNRALEHLNDLQILHDDKNVRRLGFNSNIAQLLG